MCEEGVGVLYIIDRQMAKSRNRSVVDIGFQGYARPVAQSASLIQLLPGEDFTELAFIKAIYFRHNKTEGLKIHESFSGGEKLFPPDKYAKIAEDIKRKTSISKATLESYINRNKDRIAPGELDKLWDILPLN